MLTVSTAPTGAQPGAEIGAHDFHSARLSADGMLACVTCHRSEAAFQDGLERALARQHVLPRNTPSLLNVHRHQVYFWDGRATSLEEQVDGPLLSRVELNSSTAHMLSATQSCPEVEHAWRSSSQPIEAFVRQALSAYLRTLRHGPSPLERFLARRGDLAPKAREGWRLFSTKFGCTSCHLSPHLTDNRFHDIGLPRRRLVLQTVGTQRGPDDFQLTHDMGRGDVSNQGAEAHRFRTPSLYHVTLTGPCMHDGTYRTLDEVLDFYARQRLQRGQRTFTAREREALLALFESMTETGSTSTVRPLCTDSASNGRSP